MKQWRAFSIECEVERDIYRSFKLELLTVRELMEIHDLSKSSIYRAIDSCDEYVKEYCLTNLSEIEEEEEDGIDDLFEYDSDY